MAQARHSSNRKFWEGSKDLQELEKDTPKVDNDNIFEMFNAPLDSAESKELEVYVKNMDRIAGPAAKDQKSLLIWWKVYRSYF